VYFLYILPQERDILSFALLFALNILAGIFGSAIARVFTMNFDNISKTGQIINRTLISSLIYSIIVFFGLFNFIIIRYVDFTTTTVAEFLVYLISRDFLEIVAILLAMKIVVYLFSDFLATKSVMGGG
jgi:hypothetical protein